jgi:membrane glycosyltransferase
MSKLGIIKEFFQFLRERKLWWMSPIIIILLLMILFIVLTESSAIMPFIYAIF